MALETLEGIELTRWSSSALFNRYKNHFLSGDERTESIAEELGKRSFNERIKFYHSIKNIACQYGPESEARKIFSLMLDHFHRYSLD